MQPPPTVPHTGARRGPFAAWMGALLALGCSDGPGKDHRPDDTQREETSAASAPVLAPIDDQIAVQGVPWTLEAAAEDADGDPLQWSLPEGPDGLSLEIDGTLRWTPVDVGVFGVTVRVADPGGLADEVDFLLTVVPPASPPTLAPIPDATTEAGEAWSYTASAVDPDSATLRWSLAGAPPGLTVSDAGALAWTPQPAQRGAHHVEVVVTDPGGLTDRQQFTLTVTVNQPPDVLPLSDRTLAAGQLLTLDVEATDPDVGDLLRFALDEGPPGMSLDALDGVLLWAPTTAQLGPHRVTVSARDLRGLVDSESFTVTVTAPNRPPTLAPVADQAVTSGATLVVGLVATDPDPGDTLTLSLPLAPPGVALVGDTLTWTPGDDDAGPHDVQVQVADAAGLTAAQAFIISVRPTNHPPVAVDDTWIAPRGTTTTVAPAGVLLNDMDPDGDPLTAAIVSGPSLGTVDLRPDGSFDYTPGTPGMPLVPEVAYDFGPYDWGTSTPTEWESTGATVVGDLDGDGVVEMVNVGCPGNGYWNCGYLSATHVDPSTGLLEQVYDYDSWDPADLFGMYDEIDIQSDPVLVDLDGDGPLEVVMASFCQGEITVFEHDLTPRLTTGVAGCGSGGQAFLAAADLDLDGLPEILRVAESPLHTNAVVRAFSGNGAVLWEAPIQGKIGDQGITPIAVADLDLDGIPEIIVANNVFDATGAARWSAPALSRESDSRLVAVANLDTDPFGEVVFISRVRGFEARDHDGTCLWRVSNDRVADDCPWQLLPETFEFPNDVFAADLDGDGRAEIAASTAVSITPSRSGVHVVHSDGTVAWQRLGITIGDAGDRSLLPHGITAFDFDGDGTMEVVVPAFGTSYSSNPGGTAFLDGAAGDTITWLLGGDEHIGANPSGGVWTHAVVVDVDADGAGDLITTSEGTSDVGYAGGMVIYRSGNLPWQAARPTFNQWSYAVTNATPGGDVVSAPTPNWLVSGLNNFRVNVPLPDEQGATDRFRYRASDGLADSEATVLLELRRRNSAPMFLGAPFDAVGVGQTWQERLFTFDPDPGDVVTLTLERAPHGMELAGDVLTWSTTEGDRGPHEVLISARDTEGAVALLSVTLRVLDPVVMPDLFDTPESMAGATLAALGLDVGRVRRGAHPTVAAGRVTWQDPAPDTLSVPGTVVQLVVSTGPDREDRDEDGDGATPRLGDCDDGDASIRPGATDPIDGADQDCDGLDGAQPVVRIDVEPSSLDLLVFEQHQLRAWGVLSDGSEQEVTASVTWSVNGSAATVDGQGRILASQPGVATVTATRDGVSGAVEVRVAAADLDDDVAPVAVLLRPAEGEAVLGPVDVIGTVSDPGLVRWELSLAPGGTTDFAPIASGTSGVIEGVLGQLDAATMTNGAWHLQLMALDVGGNRTWDEITVVLEGDAKVGLFTLSFGDLTIPLGGVPLEVVRRYDSRDKARGDFGVGWDLALTSASISCATTLGEGWFVARPGVTYTLLPERHHACSVRLPGGVVETFDFSPTPAASPFAPFLFTTGAFTPRPGVLGALEVIGNPHLVILDAQPGPVTLFDDVTFEVFAPERFRYTSREGTVLTLGPDGLESLVDRNGVTLTVTPDRISHSAGSFIDLERDVLGRVNRVVDPDGNALRYSYSAAGDLVTATDALGNVTRFYYNRDHGLLRIEDPLGRPAVRADYDASGRLVAAVDAAGFRTTWSFDDDAHTVTETRADGSVHVSTYDDRGRVVRASTLADGFDSVEVAWSYDEEGNPTLEVDGDGVRTARAYVDGHATEEVVDPDGLTLRTTRDVADGAVVRQVDPLGRETTFRYDARGNQSGATAPGGREVQATHGASGLPTSVETVGGDRVLRTYDVKGRLVSEERRDATGALIQLVEAEWDALGRQIAAIDVRVEADGTQTRLTTTMSYDAGGHLIEERDPTGATTRHEVDAAGQRVATVDPLGGRTEWTYDPRGLVIATRHPDGAVETFDWDARGRLARQVDADGVETTFSHDGVGNLVETARNGRVVERRAWTPGGRLARVEDGAGNVTEYTYDGAGRPIQVTLPAVPDEAGTPHRPVRTIAYDEAGRRTAIIDGTGARTTFAYDDLGRPSITTHPDGTTTEERFDLNGNLTATVDEEGRTTRFEVQAGRLAAVILPAEVGDGPRTTYGYDSLGRLRTRTDALGRTTAFTYDDRGLETRRVRPDGAARTRAHDAAGRLIRQDEPDGATLTWTWDARGRLLSRTGTAPGDAPLTESTTWTPGGRRSTAVDTSGDLTTWSYDVDGRLATVTAPGGQVLGYTYDADGRLTAMDVDGEVTTSTWSADRLVEVALPGGVARYGYDAEGRETRLTLPDGATRFTSYDTRGRPTRTRWSIDGVDLASFASTYTPAGRRSSLTELDGSVETYRYDAIGRLTEAARTGSDPYDLRYGYDEVGNRVLEVVDGVTTSATYGLSDELLTRGTVSYATDARGQRTQGEVDGAPASYGWDPFGRLASVTTGGRVTSFAYDVDGRRVAVTDPTRTQRRLYDDQSLSGYAQVVLERDDLGAEVRQRFGAGLLERTAAGATTTHLADPHGNTRALRASGSITDTFVYRPFGELQAHAGRSDDPYRYAGERWEPALDAYDLRARTYDPMSGRFLSRDPFDGTPRWPVSQHGYQYADLDPVNHVDPTGQFTQIEVGFVQAFMNSLSYLRTLNSVYTICRLDNAVQIVESVAFAGDVAAFLWNTYKYGGVATSFTWKLKGGDEFSVETTSAFYKGGWGTKMAFGVKSKAGNSSKLEVRYHKGVLALDGSAELKVQDLTKCGVNLATLSLIAKKDALSERATFELGIKFLGGQPQAKDAWRGVKASFPLVTFP